MTTLAANPIFTKLHENRGMIFPMAFISLLLVILVPLPQFVLDLLLVCNITLSVIVLVTTIYVQSPLEFAVFPSLLLAITLFRLVLNVATTRLILTAGRRSRSPAHARGRRSRAHLQRVRHPRLAGRRHHHLHHHLRHSVRRDHQGRRRASPKSPPDSPWMRCPASRWRSTPT